jgi:hypothetical protein
MAPAARDGEGVLERAKNGVVARHDLNTTRRRRSVGLRRLQADTPVCRPRTSRDDRDEHIPAHARSRRAALPFVALPAASAVNRLRSLFGSPRQRRPRRSWCSDVRPARELHVRLPPPGEPTPREPPLLAQREHRLPRDRVHACGFEQTVRERQLPCGPGESLVDVELPAHELQARTPLAQCEHVSKRHRRVPRSAPPRQRPTRWCPVHPHDPPGCCGCAGCTSDGRREKKTFVVRRRQLTDPAERGRRSTSPTPSRRAAGRCQLSSSASPMMMPSGPRTKQTR